VYIVTKIVDYLMRSKYRSHAMWAI
jgi:hypothetical protein